MSVSHFDKYDRKGAYHWADYHGGLMRMNAYTRARYDIVCDCVRNASLRDGAKLLDFGCGDGALSGVLRQRFRLTVVGVDTNRKAIGFANEMFSKHGLNGDFKLIDEYETGFPDSYFDAVVCSDVIEHVREPGAMLREMHRVLVPGGHLVISTPIRFSEDPVDPMHVQEWFVSDFVALCRQVFGDPVKVLRSHPVLWYELVASSNRWIGHMGRLLTNLLTRLAHNPFTEHDGRWRCYTTQTLVLRKDIAAASCANG